MPTLRLRSILAAALVAAGSLSVPNASRAQDAKAVTDVPALGGGVALYDDGGRATCREATPEETAALKLRAADEPLRVVKGARSNKLAGPGLTIVLRSTPQLDSFPAAKEAFVRAAETWELLISTPVTIVVDVDFGTKRFGETYPDGVLGSTDPQYHATDPNLDRLLYDTVRSKMIATASSPEEAALLAKLPESSVPTTDGTSTMMAPNTSVLRAIGILPAAADTNASYAPSIGFNSGFPFDFDESNGVDGNKFDFNFIVLHELGHVLGFDSHGRA